MGFSFDTYMGNDDMYYCTKYDNMVGVSSAYSKGQIDPSPSKLVFYTIVFVYKDSWDFLTFTFVFGAKCRKSFFNNKK